MRELTLYLFLLLMVPSGQEVLAQLSQGGNPIAGGSLKSSFQWINLDDGGPENELIESQAEVVHGRKSQRIARDISVVLNPERDGTWEWLPDGTRIWRLGIRARGARALGTVFNRFHLEAGTRLFLYDPVKERILGAYTSKNNKASAILPVGYIPGEELIIQLEMPWDLAHYGDLQVGTLRYAYLPVLDDKSWTDDYFGRSDTCNVDINCPQGVWWQGVKRAVVRMVNGELCSGVLVNNTSRDGKPYIYTAAHCVFDRITGEYQPTVFYFNYESPTCEGPDGNDRFSIAGATLVATGDTSENPRDADSLDFALLELSVAPPDSFHVYYVGWNRSHSPASHTATLHHPRGDVKKIARDYDPPENNYHEEDYLPDLVKYSHWRIVEWDLATTESGSSGCPLFDQDLHVVGNLTGGDATCANSVNDYYTRFDYAWDYYDSPAKQLKHWLDPAATGTMTLDGYDPLAAVGTGPGQASIPFRLYPNPADKLLRIQTHADDPGGTEISVYDMAGNVLLQTLSAGGGSHTLDVGNLAPGIYILGLCSEGMVSRQRFVIAR